MSKYSDLIQQYCPDGVSYIPIGECLDYEQPTNYLVSSTTYDDSYDTPVLTAGQSFILGYTNETEGIYHADTDNPVIIFDDFTTASQWVDFDFKAKSSAMKMLKSSNPNEFSIRYIYHCMQMLNYTPTDHVRHWISKYGLLKIPVPPLPLQEEIVSILDKFTELETELETKLETELEMRQKQYEYYRNKLISLEDYDGEVEWTTLGDACNVQAGSTPSTKNPEFWGGEIKWLASTVCNNRKTVDEVTKYITEAGLKKSRMMKAGTTLIALVGATIGKIAFLPFDAAINQNVAGVYPKDTKVVNPDFVYHYCSTYYPKFMELGDGKFAMANMTFVRSLPFPVLKNYDDQTKIARVLDKFSSLVEDVSEDLPAEIKMRHQQYEYYRDKLLTFKRLEDKAV